MGSHELGGRSRHGLTVFAIPKPFRDHIAVIQRNAIQSWTLLSPSVEVILFGAEEGTAEVARELGVRHEPEVAGNEYGTPYVQDVFARAQRIARHDLLAYVNADIILMSDWMAAVQAVSAVQECFLLVGQRWDVDLDWMWRFEADWERKLSQYVLEKGQPHGVTGVDYFVFPRHVLPSMPPLLVGRPLWDNWVICQARRRRVPVVDASATAMAVHQNHDYGHVPGQKGPKWSGPEADHNARLVHPYTYLFTLDGADLMLREGGLRPAHALRHLRQRINVWLSFRFPVLRSRLRSLLDAVGQR